MAQYLSPGVYVEEVDRGSKPIESVGTSTPGFVGLCDKGPTNVPTLISNWSQYKNTFGGFADSPYLAWAVYGFFLNGGSKCFVVNAGVPSKTSFGTRMERKKIDKPGEDKSTDTPAAGESSPLPTLSMGGSSSSSPSGEDISKLIGADNGPGKRTGLYALLDVEEIALVAVPGVSDPRVHEELLAHCENKKYRFAIMDSQEELNTRLDKLYRPRDSHYGATYFPWIQVYNPETQENVFVPPSGHLAGLYARTDGERGIHKAPANDILRGAIGLKYSLTSTEQELLNPRGINVIRNMGDMGIRVWGARTISGNASWRYINVRRLFIMVEHTLHRSTQWAVFEPNDERLWKKLVRDISAYLLRLRATGALVGSTPQESFFVKCDHETNPTEVVDAGMVVIEIGMAPVKPAEFVIFRIGQMAGQEKK